MLRYAYSPPEKSLEILFTGFLLVIASNIPFGWEIQLHVHKKDEI